MSGNFLRRWIITALYNFHVYLHVYHQRYRQEAFENLHSIRDGAPINFRRAELDHIKPSTT